MALEHECAQPTNYCIIFGNKTQIDKRLRATVGIASKIVTVLNHCIRIIDISVVNGVAKNSSFI